MTASASESAFQQDIIRELVEGGWVLGSAAGYDRERALYTEDCLTFVKQTQPTVWEKFVALNAVNPDKAFLDRLAAQLDKADPQASEKHLRLFGTLGVLRHGLKDKSCTFKLCQFKPDHGLNPDTLARLRGEHSARRARGDVQPVGERRASGRYGHAGQELAH